jgi:hypothetical protein
MYFSTIAMEYTITKENFIGFWRDGDGEKVFFDDMMAHLIIEMIDEEMVKNSKSFNEMYEKVLLPMVVYTLRCILGLSDEEITMYLCELLWLVLLVIANMYEDRYVDVPEIKWVFDTPDHPFEQYLATIIPDVYEKYRTTPRTLADYI